MLGDEILEYDTPAGNRRGNRIPRASTGLGPFELLMFFGGVGYTERGDDIYQDTPQTMTRNL